MADQRQPSRQYQNQAERSKPFSHHPIAPYSMVCCERMKRYALFTAAVAFSCVVPAASAKNPPTPPSEYVLDDSASGFALYPGRGVMSAAPAKSKVQSLSELKSRLRHVPTGTRLYWAAYQDDAEGNPKLFKSGEFRDFQ